MRFLDHPTPQDARTSYPVSNKKVENGLGLDRSLEDCGYGFWDGRISLRINFQSNQVTGVEWPDWSRQCIAVRRGPSSSRNMQMKK